MSDPSRRRGTAHRFWTRTLAVEVGVLLAVPLVFGAVAGFFEVNPVAGEMLSPVGSEAHLLLNGFPDDSLVVEIAYQTTAGPPPAVSVSTLLDRINLTCQKSTLRLSEHPFSSPKTTFTENDLITLETQVRETWPFWGQMSLFYLYLGGSSATSAGTIGVAYRGSSIAVFEGTIASAPGLVSATAITTTVLVHEFGHELGLVGIDGSAPNEDPAHPYHSDNSSDVMYWAVDSTAIGSLSGGPPTQFSPADLSDLKTVRGSIIPYEILPWVVLLFSALIATTLLWFRRQEIRRLGRDPPRGSS